MTIRKKSTATGSRKGKKPVETTPTMTRRVAVMDRNARVEALVQLMWPGHGGDDPVVRVDYHNGADNEPVERQTLQQVWEEMMTAP